MFRRTSSSRGVRKQGSKSALSVTSVPDLHATINDSNSTREEQQQAAAVGGPKEIYFPADVTDQNQYSNRQQQERLRQMEITQQKTLEVLSELNTSIKELRFAVNNTKCPTTPTARGVGAGNNLAFPQSVQPDNVSEIESEPDLDDGLDRKQVRLDGLEVYAVVSAVTAGTLVAVFDSYHPGDIVDLFLEGRYLEVLMSAIFLVTGSLGIVCGLHCIFVFSLVTMYGRTALGMERDDALEVFFAGTGLQRFHGFKTFVGSLYALMCELIVVITSKISSNPWVHLAALAATAKLMYYVFVDTQTIMDKAGVIFAPPPKPTPLPESDTEEEENTDDEEIFKKDDSNKKDVQRKERTVRGMTQREICMNAPAPSLISDLDDDGDGTPSVASPRPAMRRNSSESGGLVSEAIKAKMSKPTPRRRLDRKSSSMYMGADDLIKAQEEAKTLVKAQDDVKAKKRRVSVGGRRSMMGKQPSSMNFAATDLMDSD